MEYRRGDLLRGRQLLLPFDRGALDELDPPGAQLLEVLADRGIETHVGVHRRGDQDRDPAAERHRGAGGHGSVVDPMRDLRDRVRGRRSDQIEIRTALAGAEQRDVLHVPAELHHRRMARGELDDRGRHEARCIGAHHGLDVGAMAYQLAGDAGDLDRGDRSRDPEDDAPPGQEGGRSTADRIARVDHGHLLPAGAPSFASL